MSTNIDDRIEAFRATSTIQDRCILKVVTGETYDWTLPNGTTREVIAKTDFLDVTYAVYDIFEVAELYHWRAVL